MHELILFATFAGANKKGIATRMERTLHILALLCSAFYKPTGSRLRAEWETQLESKRPQTTPMGNKILEGCASKDGRFAVLHLLRYQDFRLVEVVKPLTFEDQEATIVSRLF